MASFAISVFKHQERDDKKYPISIRVTLRRASRYISTGYYVTDKQIEECEIIKKGKKKKIFELKDKFIIKQLNLKIVDYEKETVKLGGNIYRYTVDEFKNYLFNLI
jgi:hypothetical protein